MTIIELQEMLSETVRRAAADNFSVELANIATEVPPMTELGDVAFPAAFELAKQIKAATGEKTNPRAIAEKLKQNLEAIPNVERVEIAGPGYLNVFFDRAAFLSENAATEPLPDRVNASSAKVCVEHTSVNPNKAAHVGHLRNSVLGDTFQRILTATGKRVEIQNYIDNTGIQVADVVVGFLYLEIKDLDAIRRLDNELKGDGKTFDYYCWNLYAKVGQAYQSETPASAGGQLHDDNVTLIHRRAQVLHAIEEGGNAIADTAEFVATRNVECILNTLERLSIRFDLLPRESEILHLHFWDRAFEGMKRLGVIRYETEGKQAGCWVMPFEEHSGTDEHETDKILVRSNGTVTYTGKDIAYQMWKLGILGLDFNYRLFREYPDGSSVWMTTSRRGDTLVRNEDEARRRGSAEEPPFADEAVRIPAFGHGETIYNVIDSRQSYPQDIVRKGVAAISPERGEKASIHLAYEMVALSPAAADELGFVLSDEDRKKSFVEMSGRKGLGVKADDLIDRLEANALDEVESRHADLDDATKKHIAHQLAVGALRYFLLKFTRNTVIVFDFKEALSFEGETGCFCQYSAVRANSIFRKLEEKGGSVADARAAIADTAAVREVFQTAGGDEVWAMAVLASRLGETVEQAARANEPAILAKYTFNLAKSFNLFYHNHKILSEANDAKRSVLLTVADMSRRSLTAALATLGIEVPEKM